MYSVFVNTNLTLLKQTYKPTHQAQTWTWIEPDVAAWLDDASVGGEIHVSFWVEVGHHRRPQDDH